MSKDIAQTLSISINTVNRHRQNILEKLQVNNSIEACGLLRIALVMIREVRPGININSLKYIYESKILF